MNQLAHRQDVWRKATAQDIIIELSRLSRLPAEKIDQQSEEIAKDAMFKALDGVTKYALAQAVIAVLQGKLGHSFFPKPPELRMLCDDAQRPHENMARRARMTEEQMAEREQFERTVLQRSPEERARVKAICDRFCAGYEPKDAEFVSKLDPVLLAQVPDLPEDSYAFKRAKVA